MEYEILQKSAHGVSQNTYHMIWTTKYRYPLFEEVFYRQTALNAITLAAKRQGIRIFEIEIMNDNIHLFVGLPRDMPITKAFQLLKGYSSFQIRRICPHLKRYKVVWSSFTFSRTVGSVTGGVIEHYIKESNTRGQYGEQLSLKAFGRA